MFGNRCGGYEHTNSIPGTHFLASDRRYQKSSLSESVRIEVILGTCIHRVNLAMTTEVMIWYKSWK